MNPSLCSAPIELTVAMDGDQVMLNEVFGTFCAEPEIEIDKLDVLKLSLHAPPLDDKFISDIIMYSIGKIRTLLILFWHLNIQYVTCFIIKS